VPERTPPPTSGRPSGPVRGPDGERAAPPSPPRRRPVSARIEPFDSFWEGPSEVEKGYRTFGRFYRSNYVPHLPPDRDANILVISCGPGYFLQVLRDLGYARVRGVDSDPEKVAHAASRGLNARVGTAFEELEQLEYPLDVLICEQELNHLARDEMVDFLSLAHARIKPGGVLICHGLNGANPIVGAETLAQNFDHFTTFTSYSFRQVLELAGFRDVRVFGLHLYVFYANPLNYVAWLASAGLSLAFRGLFALYGKSNRIFTKKIAAVAVRPAQR
jgi:2-polyprenyl-3-methyl-5-hydroxy-6-metoxy-1,4-benzoquinol methylase